MQSRINELENLLKEKDGELVHERKQNDIKVSGL